MLTAACWLAMTGAGFAQSFDVTFKVPLNLTGIATAITKVKVGCNINSPALPVVAGSAANVVSAFVEIPVSGGQVVTTATVVVPVSRLDTSNGKTSATYRCIMWGFSQTGQDWDTFDEMAPRPIYRLSPTPANITGTFTW